MRPILRAFSLMILAIAGISAAQTVNGISARVQSEMQRWKAQQGAAERDVRLTSDVLRNFFNATNPSEGSTNPAEVNAAIEPLRISFPDYRLRYRADRDYCPVFRAIEDARKSALARLTKSLDRQQDLLVIEQIHGSILLVGQLGDLTGKPKKLSDIDRVFEREISRIGEGPTKLAWDEWDYLPSNLPGVGSGRDCN